MAFIIPRYSELLKNFEKNLGFQSKLKWKNIFGILGLHFFGLYWCYWNAFPAKWQTVVFAMTMFIYSGMGIACGAHRLWAHRTYKARFPLRILLMLSYVSAGQNSIYNWVRLHRTHHKYSDTDADPHNIRRGLFFSHMGWIMMKANTLVIEKGRQIAMDDIEADPILMFERRYTVQLSIVFCYILPILTGILLWGETWKCAAAWQCFIRPLATLHSEWSVNSFAHMFGYKLYNENIHPAENRFVSIITCGEGWHNYHHMFPYDYKASEFFDVLNISTMLIKIWSVLGLAYDLKEPSPDLVRAVVKRHRTVLSNKEQYSETDMRLVNHKRTT